MNVPWKDRHKTDEHKRELAHKDRPKPWFHGKKLPQQQREKISRALRNLYTLGKKGGELPLGQKCDSTFIG